MTATKRWALYAAVPLVAVAAVSLAFVLRSSGSTGISTVVPASNEAAATWAAGEKRAPAFVLHDEHGAAVSLAALRGRPVIITFIDPLCRDFCPLEARHLSDVVRAADPKPVVVAVSVNIAGNDAKTLALDRRKWRLVPQWRWGIGGHDALARVWRLYHVQVLVTPKDVAHTEAAYLVDAHGYQRALFLWPYAPRAVADALRALPAAS